MYGFCIVYYGKNQRTVNWLLSAYLLPVLEHGLLSACNKRGQGHHVIRTFMPSLTPERKDIMAAASGSQRTLDGRVLNQEKQLRMSYTREYELELVKAYQGINLYQTAK